MRSEASENAISDQLNPFLEREVPLSDHQYGFRLRRSMGDLLAVVKQTWSAPPDNHGEIHLVSLDILKSLDRAQHGDLLSKLSPFGSHLASLSWTSCSFSKRTIFVRVQVVLSQTPLGILLCPKASH